MRLLPPRDERLPERAADASRGRTGADARARGEAEELVRPRRSQPLESRAATCGASKSSRTGAAGNGWAGSPGRRRFERGIPSPSSVRSQPSSRPTIFWIAVSRPSVQRPRLAQRPAAQIDHVGLAVGRFDEIGVTGALQLRRPGGCARSGRGLSGCSSYGPVRFRERAIVTA